jgi:hypothetical protein
LLLTTAPATVTKPGRGGTLMRSPLSSGRSGSASMVWMSGVSSSAMRPFGWIRDSRDSCACVAVLLTTAVDAAPVGSSRRLAASRAACTADSASSRLIAVCRFSRWRARVSSRLSSRPYTYACGVKPPARPSNCLSVSPGCSW